MQTPTAERPSPLRTWLAIALTTVLAVVGSVMFAPAERADAAALPPSILEGGYLISDAEFFDGNSMTASQIQSFLNSQVSTCRAASGNPTCLKSFKATLPSKSADKYCKAVSGKSNATAAEIIDRVAAACSINPKVILVMLQKEQGLVTSSAPSSWAYQAAMGQSCPDTAPCDAAAAGFVNQVYLGARQMQVYTMNPSWWNYKAGEINTIQWHPNRSCGTSKVYVQNQATANLYIYTPYRPNVAALAAGYGTGDACSTYGNRNFYNYYVDWFAPDASASSGAPAQTDACQLPLTVDIAHRAGAAKVKIDGLNVRTAPTLRCGSGITQLDKGDAVSVTGAYGAWTRALVGSRTMWMYSSYLELPSTGAPEGGSDACAQPAASSIEKASGEVVVTTSVLNARSAPSTSCSVGRTQLAQGDKATRTGIYGAWWRVSLSEKTYWVHSDYVAVGPGPVVEVPPPVTPVAERMMVTSAAVNLRVEASTSSARVRLLLKDTEVTVVGVAGVFKQVRVGDQSGFVHGDYLTDAVTPVAEQVMVTSAAVNLRVEASTSSARVRLLLKDTEVTVVGVAGVFKQVRVGDQSGFVHGDYLTDAVTPVAEQVMVTSAAVNLRVEASTSSARVRLLLKDTEVTVVGVAGVFKQVRVGDQSGFVHGDYLTDAVTPVAEQVMVTSAAVNLRVEASTSSARVRLLLKDTEVTVVGVAGVFKQVRVGDQSGFVHGDHLTDAVTPVAEQVMVTSAAVNLRVEASTSSARVRLLLKDTEVTVVGVAGVFKQVRVGDQSGFVHGDYLTDAVTPVAEQVMVTSAAVNLRVEASTSSARVRLLLKDTEVTVVGVAGVFKQVRVGDQSGFVHGDYLTDAVTPVADSTTAETMTTTHAVNLREAPATSSARVSLLAPATVVSIVSSDGVWREVQTGSLKGWVHSDYLD